jgi:hypothetical protein
MNSFTQIQRTAWSLTALLLLMVSNVFAADNGFERALLPLLQNHCFDCHDEDTQKGDLTLHTLNPDVVNCGDEAVWAAVLDQLNSGKMPPKKKKRPPEKRLLTALNWLTEELDKAEVAANARGSRIVMRRLNRLEYRNTMRDLFGHPFDPTELFSPDTVSGPEVIRLRLRTTRALVIVGFVQVFVRRLVASIKHRHRGTSAR